MGVASLVLGIVSIVFTFFGPTAIIGFFIGIVGIVMGVLARKKAMEAPEGSPEASKRGMATAGFVCSIIGTVLCGITFFACASLVGGLAALGSSY